MKAQIKRFTPHQNGKVFGILMALGSLVFIVPMGLFFSTIGPQSPGAPPPYVFLLFPIMYLIFGYLSIAVGCLLYNVMYRYIGGLEYESEKGDA